MWEYVLSVWGLSTNKTKYNTEKQLFSPSCGSTFSVSEVSLQTKQNIILKNNCFLLRVGVCSQCLRSLYKQNKISYWKTIVFSFVWEYVLSVWGLSTNKTKYNTEKQLFSPSCGSTFSVSEVSLQTKQKYWKTQSKKKKYIYILYVIICHL